MGEFTPTDTPAVSFDRAPIGSRGYDERQVDAYVARVEHTIAALTAEVATLRSRLDGDTGEQSPGPSPAAESAVLAELDQIKTRLARIEAAMARGGPQPSASDRAYGEGGLGIRAGADT